MRSRSMCRPNPVVATLTKRCLPPALRFSAWASNTGIGRLKPFADTSPTLRQRTRSLISSWVLSEISTCPGRQADSSRLARFTSVPRMV